MHIPNIAYFILLVTTFCVFIFSIMAIFFQVINRKKNKKKSLTDVDMLNAEHLSGYNSEKIIARKEAKTQIEQHTKARIVEIEYHEEEKPKLDHPYNRNLIKFK